MAWVFLARYVVFRLNNKILLRRYGIEIGKSNQICIKIFCPINYPKYHYSAGLVNCAVKTPIFSRIKSVFAP
jgi:hypothetical protein